VKHEPDLSRAQQIAEAVALVRGLLGERDASKVRVEVTRGGTYRIDAEAGDGAKVTEYASIGRRR